MNPYAAQMQQNEVVMMELRFMSDLMHKMSDQCFKKCIAKFAEGDLTRAEQECVDRCVDKYMDATNKVGEVFAIQGQQQAAQQPR